MAGCHRMGPVSPGIPGRRLPAPFRPGPAIRGWHRMSSATRPRVWCEHRHPRASHRCRDLHPGRPTDRCAVRADRRHRRRRATVVKGGGRRSASAATERDGVPATAAGWRRPTYARSPQVRSRSPPFDAGSIPLDDGSPAISGSRWAYHDRRAVARPLLQTLIFCRCCAVR